MAPRGAADAPSYFPPQPITDDDASSYLSESDDGTGSTSSSQRKRQIRSKQIVRIVACVFSTIAALCAGSVVVFSLYAPKFQSRLKYTQFQVNGVAIGSSLALYLPICVMGYVCDRYGVQPLMALSSVLFAIGYGLAAWIYQKLDVEYRNLGHKPRSSDWSFPLMIFAFVCIGAGTCAMYISTVSTCAKNFGKGKYRGLILAMPITGFGLSGMWLSQFASHFLYELNPDGSKGEVDVYRFFVFMAVLLFVVGVVGAFTMRVVDERELIEEAIEEMENSGFLDGSSLLSRRASTSRSLTGPLTPAHEPNEEDALLGGPSKADDDKWKKDWVLNAETRRFLTDHTMWPFAIAFLFMIGPGEAFVNNLGSVIGTLTPPGVDNGTTADIHVSVFSVTSTLARILIGTITDLVAPSPDTSHVQLRAQNPPPRRFSISRINFMLFFGCFLAFGFIFLGSGAVQNHPERFWVVSGFVGAGYGATFSLTPLIVTIIWGVENFATNFGIIALLPAVGSTFWGLIYSAGYQAGARKTLDGDDDDLFCYGQECYSGTFWAEGICVLVGCCLLLWAWKGKGGWQQRKIAI